MSNEAILHAYRHLYRQSLRAIQFSKPARYTLRDRLRLAFRKGSIVDFEPQKVQNTLDFLQYATRENGLEHKIIKNLLFVWWTQSNGGRSKPKARTLTWEEHEIKTTAYDPFNHNIRMLNESMGLCLPSMTVRDPN
ncbi:DUF1763-domain-containing protein [Cucurbitaria berberidis CBS 394.84]|uniref:DUF1763-domain-containing protein n=1 Tax=Cucurbitaria berberidis CBS 394.84 TaxID=1168544 RepID=A0A9P4GKE6_9PLEO|nr:DUF1763-domain-containing protein [Cucurbitaria berberidis CBS 394.84]KAF1846715.1 DUF1763-domain-containing protein [Cucurbitaria berberidis CBS 394.84]